MAGPTTSHETTSKSGVHLTGVDSGWPVASAAETGSKKDGTGAQPAGKATAVAASDVTVVTP